MRTPTNREAEWTPVTPEPRQGDDDRITVGRELDEVRNGLGLSERALAGKLGVDRETLKRFFAGDASMRPNKWKMIEKRIRELDAEMTSEGAGDAAPAEMLIELRIEPPDGGGATVILRGPIENLPAMEESVARLVQRMNQLPPD